MRCVLVSCLRPVYSREVVVRVIAIVTVSRDKHTCDIRNKRHDIWCLQKDMPTRETVNHVLIINTLLRNSLNCNWLGNRGIGFLGMVLFLCGRQWLEYSTPGLKSFCCQFKPWRSLFILH